MRAEGGGKGREDGGGKESDKRHTIETEITASRRDASRDCESESRTETRLTTDAVEFWGAVHSWG